MQLHKEETYLKVLSSLTIRKRFMGLQQKC